MLLYVHRNRRLIRDGIPGRPPRLHTAQLFTKAMVIERTEQKTCRFAVQNWDRERHSKTWNERLCIFNVYFTGHNYYYYDDKDDDDDS